MNSITQVTPRSRKARGQGASRREEILRAAKRLFIEQGVEHVTMRGIASAVGVSATALYVYFQDKDAIMQAIATESFQTLRRTLEAAMLPGAGPEETLRAGLHSYIAFAQAHVDEYRLVFMQDARLKKEKHEIDEAELSFGMLLNSVQAMLDAGLFAPNNPVLLAETLWACLHGVVAMLMSCAEAVESSPDQLINHVIDTAIAGMKRTL